LLENERREGVTKISEAAKRQACELANAVIRHPGDWKWCVGDIDWTPSGAVPASRPAIIALARVLQERSDVAKSCAWRINTLHSPQETVEHLQSLILPDEPDPLLDIIKNHYAGSVSPPQLASSIRTELAKRGLKIVEVGDDFV